MSFKPKKYKKPKDLELEQRRFRVFRWCIILLITWYSLQNLPNPEVSEPKYNPKIEQRISKLDLGDTLSFDALEFQLEKIVNTNASASILELENQINRQKEIHDRNFKILHERRLAIMKINDINYKINNQLFDANSKEKEFNYVVKYFRQIFDPSLNFMEALSNEELIHELENPEYIKHHADFYVESRIPDVLQNEMRETYKLVRKAQNNIEGLNTSLSNVESSEKEKIQDKINNYKKEIKFIYLLHQIRLYNDVLPYFTKFNQEVPEYNDLGDELVKRIYSIIKKSVTFFENLLKDEIIIEIATIYILFVASELGKLLGFHILESLKGNFFKGLYMKARLTSGINNGIQKIGRFIETTGDRFYKFQNIVLESDNFPKIMIFNQGKLDFEATINNVKTKIIDFFDQSDTRFASKSKVNLFFGDIQYFRNSLLLNTKMILQFPTFLIEKQNVELAWDMIADGDSPFLWDTFNLPEDGEKLNYSLQLLTHVANENNFTKLQDLLTSKGFNFIIEKHQSDHSQLFSDINSKISGLVSTGDEKSLSELRHDISLINKLVRSINKYGLETITILNIFFVTYKSLVSDMEVNAVNILNEREEKKEAKDRFDSETLDYFKKLRESSFVELSSQSREFMDTELFSYFNLTPYHFQGKYLKSSEIKENEELKTKGNINSTFNSIYDFEFMNFLVHLQARETVWKIQGDDIIKTIVMHTIEHLSAKSSHNSFLNSLSNFVSKDPKDFWERKKSIFI